MIPARAEIDITSINFNCDNPLKLVDTYKEFSCLGQATIKVIKDNIAYNVCEQCHRELIGEQIREEYFMGKQTSNSVFIEASEEEFDVCKVLGS